MQTPETSRSAAQVVAALAVASLLFAATHCSLTDVADYPIESCAVADGATLIDDPCARLNVSLDGCDLYQCDTATGACESRARDFDRDGEADVACGGSDCDDLDPEVGAALPEICDASPPYRDNDCDGEVDEGVLAVGALASGYPLQGSTDVRVEGGDELRATFVQKLASGQCIQGIDAGYQLLRDGCVFPGADDAGFLPRQPTIAPIGVAGHATAYVEVGGGCVVGSLGYRVYDQGQVAGRVLGPCLDGAALPAMHVLGDRTEALLFHIDAPVNLRDDAVEDCPGVASAPLLVTRVKQAATPQPKMTATWTLSAASRALAPPSLATLAGLGALVAAPHEDGAALWMVDEETDSPPEPLPLQGFDEARAMSMAARGTGPFEVAVVGELGCAPQKLVFQLLQLTPPNLEPRGAVVEMPLPEGAELATSARVVWLTAREEWLVTWLVDGPAFYAQRLTATGDLLGAPMLLGEDLTAAAVDADGNVLAFSPATSPAEFRGGVVGCL